MKAGTARVETHGAAVPFGGLATGGGGAGAAYTDFKDFCCPEYLTTMVQLVQRNWQQNQGVDGTVMVKFTISRDGRIQDVQVEEQSTPFLESGGAARGDADPAAAAVAGGVHERSPDRPSRVSIQTMTLQPLTLTFAAGCLVVASRHTGRPTAAAATAADRRNSPLR